MAVLFGITVPEVQWLIKTGEGIGKGPVPHTLRDPHARRGGCGVGTDRQTHRRSTDPRRERRQPPSCLQGTGCNCAHARKPFGTPPHLERTKGAPWEQGRPPSNHHPDSPLGQGSPSLQEQTHCTRHSFNPPQSPPWVAPGHLHRPPTYSLLSGGAPAPHIPLPFLLPGVCTHCPPSLPTSVWGMSPSPNPPWQLFSPPRPPHARER